VLQVTFAFEMYKRTGPSSAVLFQFEMRSKSCGGSDDHHASSFFFTDEEGIIQSHGFKKTFSRTVDIEFVGVWYVRG
jgi:hypothetical protein